MEQFLKENIWNRCSKLLLPTKSPAWKLFDKYIKQPYTEPHRHYHNLNHIATLFTELEVFKQAYSKGSQSSSLCSPGLLSQGLGGLALDLAILFHDAVYNPVSKVNEEDSVAWLRQFLSEAKHLWEGEGRRGGGDGPSVGDSAPQVLWLDVPMTQYVEHEAARFIMGTKDHFDTSSSSPSTPRLGSIISSVSSTAECSEDEIADPLHLVLDLDLTVFGSTWRSYVRYVEGIRMEYKFYSDVDFMDARYKFIQQVLDQPRVFKTHYFYDKYERAAFENLKREQKEMKKAISEGKFYLPSD